MLFQYLSIPLYSGESFGELVESLFWRIPDSPEHEALHDHLNQPKTIGNAYLGTPYYNKVVKDISNLTSAFLTLQDDIRLNHDTWTTGYKMFDKGTKVRVNRYNISKMELELTETYRRLFIMTNRLNTMEKGVGL